MLTNLHLFFGESGLDVNQLSLFLAVGLLADFRERLEAIVILYEVVKLFMQFFTTLQDLLASLNELLAVEVLGELSGHLLLRIVTILLNQNNILQLFDVFMKLFKLQNLIIQTLLELLLDFLDLLLHFLLVVGHVNGFTEDLVLLLLVDLLQLLQAVAHRRDARLDFKKGSRARQSHLLAGLDLLF